MQVQKAIQNMFYGSVPRRKNEISELMKDLQIFFQMLPDEHKDGRVILCCPCGLRDAFLSL
jgi:hypothetical protein